VADHLSQVDCRHDGSVEPGFHPIRARLSQQQGEQRGRVEDDARHSALASRARSARKSATDTPALSPTSLRLRACARATT
jgi:hypothetical protein